MEYVNLPNTDLRVTRLGLGGCPLGGHGWGRVDEAESRRAVQTALDQGISLFDTADVYGLGHSERVLSESLGPHRHRVTIASKFGVRWNSTGLTWKDASPKYLRQALNASLRRLRVDCIPLYYVHWPDPSTPIEETLTELERLRCAGKIGAIGLSNFDASQLDVACDLAPIAALQLQYSLVDRQQAQAVLEVAQRRGVPFVTWGSLAQGLLTGKFDATARFDTNDRRHRYDNFSGEKFKANLRVVQSLKLLATELGKSAAQIALRWVLDSSNVSSVLFGAKNSLQVKENLSALDWRLPSGAYQRLEELRRQESCAAA